ncbi:LamG-like jellyroll fold domain-containing protein [Allomuricauda sp. M10]|uniref:LamG-like jellyroll fold domain-containing protein n=1 Tax=Allomuricauda sp. M10 TaxID=2683292 RepID=UPI001D189E5A|nr:LamG-like jellyroll fold domain-containing protein [Muricauda sp. M10]
MERKKHWYLKFLSLFLIIGCSSDNGEGEKEIIPIKANFTINSSEILVNESVSFSDSSSGNPTSWTWTFNGGIPSTSNQQNPVVTYNNAGTYSVKLVASNIETSDEIVKEGIITVNHDLTNGLIIQVLLDGNAQDTSSNNYPSEIIGTVNPTTNRNGDANKAMEFNENDGFIAFYSIDELEIEYSSTITVSVWINPNGNQNEWDTILNQYFGGPPPSAVGRFYLGLNPSNQRVRWNVFENHLESSNPIPINEWTHILVSYNERNAKMYINGNLDGELNLGPETYLLGSGAPFRIGKQSLTPSTTSGFSGIIDDINIFNRILDEEEILLLFNQ